MSELSEKITDRRCDRLDEWSMDELARDTKKLEDEIAKLKGENTEMECLEASLKSVERLLAEKDALLKYCPHCGCTYGEAEK